MKRQNKHSVKHRRLRARKLWVNATKRRRIKHFYALPKEIQKELVIVHEYVLARDPGARMKLTGSWLKGTWVSKKADKEFHKHLLEVKNKIGLSDLDIILESEYPFTKEELQALINTKLDVWKMRCDKVNGITVNPGPRYRRLLEIGEKDAVAARAAKRK